MQRFSFRLQTVANLREKEENLRKEELAEARRHLLTEEEHLSNLYEKKRLYQSQLFFSQGEKLDLPGIALLYAYLDDLERQITLQGKRVEQAEAEVENRRQILVKASQNRKILEKLREKRYLDYRHEANRQEQIFLDEIAGRLSVPGRNGL